MTDENARKADRHTIWFPMQVRSNGEMKLAISRDISEHGAKLVTAAPPAVGEHVTVILALPEEARVHEMRGKIVRLEENSDDPRGAWPHRIAVEFDEPLEGLDPFLSELAKESGPL